MRLFRSASTRCSLRRWARRWRWLKEQAGYVLGILVCLVLIAVFVPLIPVFKAFGEIGEAVRDDE
jgi:hypothetical protein